MKSTGTRKNHTAIQGSKRYLAMPGFYLFISLLIILPDCKKKDGTPSNVAPALQLVADNLTSPLGVLESPDASKRLFIIDQVGKVWIVKSDGTRLPDPFIDLSSKIVTLRPQYDERGLLGLAFHPAFNTN